MIEEKLNPLQTVALEMSNHSEMTFEQIEKSLLGLLEHLKQRAHAAIEDKLDEDALDFAREYRAAAELIATFGTQLIAFEDMEESYGEGELTN